MGSAASSCASTTADLGSRIASSIYPGALPKRSVSCTPAKQWLKFIPTTRRTEPFHRASEVAPRAHASDPRSPRELPPRAAKGDGGEKSQAQPQQAQGRRLLSNPSGADARQPLPREPAERAFATNDGDDPSAGAKQTPLGTGGAWRTIRSPSAIKRQHAKQNENTSEGERSTEWPALY